MVDGIDMSNEEWVQKVDGERECIIEGTVKAMIKIWCELYTPEVVLSLLKEDVERISEEIGK